MCNSCHSYICHLILYHLPPIFCIICHPILYQLPHYLCIICHTIFLAYGCFGFQELLIGRRWKCWRSRPIYSLFSIEPLNLHELFDYLSIPQASLFGKSKYGDAVGFNDLFSKLDSSKLIGTNKLLYKKLKRIRNGVFVRIFTVFGALWAAPPAARYWRWVVKFEVCGITISQGRCTRARPGSSRCAGRSPGTRG